LGELLIKEGLISQADLEKAISTQRQGGGRLGEIIVNLGITKEEEIVRVLGKQLGAVLHGVFAHARTPHPVAVPHVLLFYPRGMVLEVQVNQ